MENLLQKESLTQKFIDSFIKTIVKGDFVPGEQIPSEAEIAERFGVSRTLVREGISTLASMGLITKRQGMQSRVSPRNTWDILNRQLLKVLIDEKTYRNEVLSGLYEMRLLIECHAASEAAKRRTEEDLARMRGLLDNLDGTEDEDDIIAADSQLHQYIHESMHDLVFSSILKKFDDLLKLAHNNMIVRDSDINTPIIQHREIIACIEKGDSEGARASMEKHLLWTLEKSVD